MTILQLFRDAGVSGLALLFVTFLGVPLALAVIGLSLAPKRARLAMGLSGVLLAAGVGDLLIGALGRVSGERASLRAVAHANPEYRPTLLAVAVEEMRASTTLGLSFGSPLVALAVAAMVLGGLRLRTVEAP